jgi:hypothetical protein
LRAVGDVRILVVVRLASLLALIIVAGCTQAPIGQPAGSNNYDDPYDPGNPGQNSSGPPDAGGDASGRFCVAARDCPATMVCAYPVADLCGAAGRCLPYDASPSGCTAPVACGCDGTNVPMCAPDGYAPNQAIASTSPCDAGAPDATPPDAAADAADDGSTDASSD